MVPRIWFSCFCLQMLAVFGCCGGSFWTLGVLQTVPNQTQVRGVFYLALTTMAVSEVWLLISFARGF